MTVSYEWFVEDVTDDDPADVISFCAWDTREECEKDVRPVMCGERREIGLMRTVRNDYGDIIGRQWAYLDDGELPAEFDGGAKVPARFRGGRD
jgi:hypothetical protein